MHACMGWWVVCGVTRLSFEALKPWRPHQLIILTVGMMLTKLVYLPFTEFIDQVFLTAFQINTQNEKFMDVILQHASDSGLTSGSIRDYVIWLAINLIFDRLFGMPRYRYKTAGQNTFRPFALRGAVPIEPNTESNSSTQSPSPEEDQSLSPSFAFLRHLDNPPKPDAILALKAEQHYIKVLTKTKKPLVLYRFGDALAEIPPNSGLQVHRSWWVRNDAIEGIYQRGRKMYAQLTKMYAQLTNGTRVPISEPHQGLLRKIAKDRGISIHPLPTQPDITHKPCSNTVNPATD